MHFTKKKENKNVAIMKFAVSVAQWLVSPLSVGTADDFWDLKFLQYFSYCWKMLLFPFKTIPVEENAIRNDRERPVWSWRVWIFFCLTANSCPVDGLVRAGTTTIFAWTAASLGTDQKVYGVPVEESNSRLTPNVPFLLLLFYVGAWRFFKFPRPVFSFYAGR